MAVGASRWVCIPADVLDVLDVLGQTAHLDSGAYDYFIPPTTPPLVSVNGEVLPHMPGSSLSAYCPSDASPTLSHPAPNSDVVPVLHLAPDSPNHASASSHNKKRRHANRANKRKCEAEAGRVISEIKRQRHVQTAEALTLATNVSNTPVAETGYMGLLGNDTRKREYSLLELCGENSRFHMQHVPYTGP